MNPRPQPKSRLTDTFIGLIEAVPASDRLILKILFFIVIFSGVWLLYDLNQKTTESTAVHGGLLREGIVGTPRFVNPALAITRADQDTVALVYSGLMRIGIDGDLEPNIAKEVTVSEDGLTYNIILNENTYFHDGVKLTAKDVVYTIQLIQDPELKSPLRGNWIDISIEEIGEYELNIILKEAYAPFIENFTLGIMPAHLWNSLPTEQIPFSQLNTEPVGSGPFHIVSAGRDSSGLIDSYLLAPSNQNPNAPKINQFELHFYSNEQELLNGLKQGLVDASAYISNENLTTVTEDGSYQVIKEPLPRIFAIFFNQNKSAALRDPAVRKALTVAIDRDELIKTALFGQGVPITTPITQPLDAIESAEGSEVVDSIPPVEQAKEILVKAGWIENNLGLLEKQIDGSAETLSITLRTSNVPLFDSTLQIVKRQWEAIGVEVITEEFEQTGLVQSVIRPRDFQALLFGLDMSRSQDLYPFWHSSQKNDPGLNIAEYTNLSVDALLETARTEQDAVVRQATLAKASEIITTEQPAIFLFQPMLTYVVDKDIILTPIRQPGRASDRFSNTTNWYTDSDNLWPIFKQDI